MMTPINKGYVHAAMLSATSSFDNITILSDEELLANALMKENKNDYQAAMKIYVRLADKGCMKALDRCRKIVQVRYSNVMDVCQNAAANRSPAALYLVGFVHVLEAFAQPGLAYFEKADELGFLPATVDLGLIYVDPTTGIRTDYEKASFYFQKAASRGSAVALYNLGVMHQKGHGVVQDAAEALNYYKQAAEKGHPKASTKLFAMWLNGTVVEHEIFPILSHLQKAAEQGNKNASGQLNQILADLKKGESLGIRVISNMLGHLYFNGICVQRDHALALTHFQKGFLLGDTHALFNMGVVYARGGYGVQQDDSQALFYFDKAARLGLDIAKYYTSWLMYKKDDNLLPDDPTLLDHYKKVVVDRRKSLGSIATNSIIIGTPQPVIDLEFVVQFLKEAQKPLNRLLDRISPFHEIKAPMDRLQHLRSNNNRLIDSIKQISSFPEIKAPMDRLQDVRSNNNRRIDSIKQIVPFPEIKAPTYRVQDIRSNNNRLIDNIKQISPFPEIKAPTDLLQDTYSNNKRPRQESVNESANKQQRLLSSELDRYSPKPHPSDSVLHRASTTRSVVVVNREEFVQVIQILRSKSQAKFNCAHLAADFLKYLLSGKIPDKQSNIRPCSIKNIRVEPHYEVSIKHDKVVAQIAKSRITHADNDYPTLVQSELMPSPVDIDTLIEMLKIDDYDQQSAHYLGINSALKSEAARSEFNVSFGLVNLGRALPLKYMLVEMSSTEPRVPNQIEFHCDENGFHYRLRQSKGELISHSLAWNVFPNEMPREQHQLRQQQYYFLPYILNELKKLAHIDQFQHVLPAAGHQLIYFATPETVLYIDPQGYTYNENGSIAEEDFIYSELTQHYRFFGQEANEINAAKNTELWGENVFFVSFSPRVENEAEVQIKLEPDEAMGR